jgi:hypothetical protein
MKLRSIFYNILTGIPGGLLIIMSMLMFSAILGKLFFTGSWLMLVLLCLTSFITGLLARLLQPFHGVGTAFTSGGMAALLILFLRLSFLPAPVPETISELPGMVATITFSLLGAWCLPHLHKRT